MQEKDYPENYTQELIDVQKKMETLLYDCAYHSFSDDRVRVAFIQDVATNFMGNMFLSVANEKLGEPAKEKLLEQAMHGFQSWVLHRKIDLEQKKDMH